MDPQTRLSARRLPHRHGRVRRVGLVAAGLLSLSGCHDSRSMLDAFPPGTVASPWVLDGDVWSGSFASARDALGEEADAWGAFEPQRVWLATYRHDQDPRARLTIRAWAFASREAARRAYDHFEPLGPDRRAFDAGDRGCWTSDGVLFVWGRMVFDIFGSDPSRAASAEQAAYLSAHVERRVPVALLEAPR